MFASARGGHPITVLDWQSFAYGAGPTDLAYFLAGAPAPEVRRAARARVAGPLPPDPDRAWASRGYAMADLKRHYGQGGYLLFLTAFFAAMIVTQTERGDEMFLHMVSGAADHMLDHGA